MMMALSSLCEGFWKKVLMIHVLPVCFHFSLKVEISSHTPVPVFQQGSVAQRDEMTVAKCP